MKFKYFALMSLAAVAFSACTDDSDYENYNTNAGVTVDLKDTAIRVSEDQLSSTSFSYIPVVVNGETNGDLYVTIEVSPYGEHPAVADENYIITAYTIRIPAGETTGQFQYYPTGDNEINDDRSFEVKIKDVKGASIGSQDKTVVTLVDNEGLIPIYYTGLAGEWDVVAESVYYGPTPFTTTIEVCKEDETGYGTAVKLYNFPYEGVNVEKATFSVDGVEQAIYISIPSGQKMGGNTDPVYGYGDVTAYPSSGNSLTTAPYDFVLKFNFDLKSGEYVQDPDWEFTIFSLVAAGYLPLDTYSAITFTR